jgi:8-oxo-dGTP pyrophosphatase MutT (NUDIX family)
VRYDRPASGEELNLGTPTRPRPAASLILLRDRPRAIEVLLVQRSREQRFMGGAWVFPGGAVQPEEDAAVAAVRELEEEASIRLGDESALVPFSRWITPAEIKLRFDTRFFAARAPAAAEPTPDGAECVDARWLAPGSALDAFSRAELTLVFPTIKHLEELAGFRSTDEVLAAARGRVVEPIQPQVVVEGGTPRVVMPGEPGYQD